MMGLYMNAISGGNTIGPLVCGFVVTGASWRVQKWLAFGLVAVNFLAVVLFVPETQYDRDIAKSFGPMGGDGVAAAMASADEEGALEKTASTTLGVTKLGDELAQTPKKTWVQEMSLWNGVPKDTSLLKLFIRPLPMMVYPAVIYAFLIYAVSLAWVVAINILNSFVLQAPPYNWSPAVNGLINIPGFIGNVIGAFLGGWLVDRYSDWRAKKNNGVFYPETRLVLLIIPTLIVPAGCLAFGFGVARTLHWTSLFFGYGMVAVGLTAVGSLAVYCFKAFTDDYPGSCCRHDLRLRLLLSRGTRCTSPS